MPTFFFSWWLGGGGPCGTWSSWARDQIRAAAAAMLDPLIPCAGLGIEPPSWCYRDTTNPVVPYWEHCLLLISLLPSHTQRKKKNFLYLLLNSYRQSTLPEGSKNFHNIAFFMLTNRRSYSLENQEWGINLNITTVALSDGWTSTQHCTTSAGGWTTAPAATRLPAWISLSP